ncbi:MAG: hypothetical protein ACLPWF_07905 [Bryobacteraceae bacterium]|jgi:hypothetical protein
MLIRRLLALVTFLSLWPCRAEVVPATSVTALDGSLISFPRKEGQKPLLLVLGFSHKSDKTCDSWNRFFTPAHVAESGIEYYELADFQGVPSFVMKMILHAMRKSVPKDAIGRIVWHAHGAATGEKYTELQAEIAKLTVIGR